MIELKTADEVRAHARMIQRRIDAQRNAPPEPSPARRPPPPIAMHHDDEVPEGDDLLPLHAATGRNQTRAVLRIAAKYFGLSLEEVTSASRATAIAMPRQIGFFVARCLGASYPKIGRECRRDHSTVHHGCRCIKERVQTDDALAGTVDAIGTEAAAIFGVYWRPARAKQNDDRRTAID
jgi:hypothetical protein